MELELGFTATIFGKLVRTHGKLSERASMRGNKMYELTTAAGTYTAPAVDGGPPGDHPTFTPASASSPWADGPFAVPAQALQDPEILALLSQATIKWKRSIQL